MRSTLISSTGPATHGQTVGPEHREPVERPRNSTVCVTRPQSLVRGRPVLRRLQLASRGCPVGSSSNSSVAPPSSGSRICKPACWPRESLERLLGAGLQCGEPTRSSRVGRSQRCRHRDLARRAAGRSGRACVWASRPAPPGTQPRGRAVRDRLGGKRTRRATRRPRPSAVAGSVICRIIGAQHATRAHRQEISRSNGCASDRSIRGSRRSCAPASAAAPQPLS